MNAFNHFIEEIEGSPKFVQAVAADPTWADQLAEWQRMVSSLDGHADDDPRLLDFLDELGRIVQSGEPLKVRIGRVLDAFIAASKIWPDTAARHGMADDPRRKPS
jgi:hypothetical protein